jgi:hypothetical protein
MTFIATRPSGRLSPSKHHVHYYNENQLTSSIRMYVACRLKFEKIVHKIFYKLEVVSF